MQSACTCILNNRLESVLYIMYIVHTQHAVFVCIHTKTAALYDCMLYNVCTYAFSKYHITLLMSLHDIYDSVHY